MGIAPTTTEGARATAVQACAGAGCTSRQAAGNGRHLAAAGGRLCPACRERLSVELGRLPELYEACGRRLDGRSSDPSRPKTSGGPLPGMAFNAGAAEARTEILGVLGSWAGAVVKERRAPAPRRAVLPLAAFLDRHLDWLAGHDAAGEFSGEVARLVRRARRVVDPEVRHQVPIGACVEPGCTGSLAAVVRPQQPQLPAVIRCDRDPAHLWLGHEWLQLRRRLSSTVPEAGTENAAVAAVAADATTERPAVTEPELVRWVTAADIARLWAVPTGSVYRHASESKWRRRSHQGRTYYHGGDVMETLRGRRVA
ncbi:hypothetical protein [Streptomyces lutosisoli]|uniref:Helix-turn-helix domain-containing protein n=1 Tax=Streptomyces lutosisoli TaxID=2665721 RepID=A0ABW2VK24_9ACTN